MRRFHREVKRKGADGSGLEGEKDVAAFDLVAHRKERRAAHVGGGQPDRAAAPTTRGERRRRGDGPTNEPKAKPCWARGRK
jgi:hypothetical protein